MPTSSKKAVLDTNILVYAMNSTAPEHGASKALRDKGVAGHIEAYVTPQILFEYFAVVTNARFVTTPISGEEALADVESMAAAFNVLTPPADLTNKVVALTRQLGFKGRHIFDVQIAATMLSAGITDIYTYDDRFEKIPGLVVHRP